MNKSIFTTLKENKSVAVRIILFVFAWLNSHLAKKGLQPLPVLDEVAVSNFLTFVVSIWTLVADNSLKREKKEIR